MAFFNRTGGNMMSNQETTSSPSLMRRDFLTAHALPPLPYADNAPAPVISAKTIGFHYNKHYKDYVDKLNKVVAGVECADLPLQKIIAGTAGQAESGQDRKRGRAFDQGHEAALVLKTYLCYRLTGEKLKWAGKHLDISESAVCHASKRAKEQNDRDRKLKKKVGMIEKKTKKMQVSRAGTVLFLWRVATLCGPSLPALNCVWFIQEVRLCDRYGVWPGL
jgi:superoxide dismutase